MLHYHKSPIRMSCFKARGFFYQGGETDLIQRIDSDVTNINAISKCFIAIPWKFKCPLTCPVCVKTELAENATDLFCIKLDINVSKCFTKVQHFETLISSLIQNKSVSFSASSVFTHILFIILYRTYKRTFKFLWNSDKTFLITFLYKLF